MPRFTSAKSPASSCLAFSGEMGCPSGGSHSVILHLRQGQIAILSTSSRELLCQVDLHKGPHPVSLSSDENTLDFIKCNIVFAPVVQFRSPADVHAPPIGPLGR